jgi:hypothetical protein
MARWLDRVLVLLFLLMAFTSLVYMPWFLASCGWRGLALGADGPCSQSWVGRAWLGYLKVEPLYAHAPVWLQQLNEFDSYLFGWFYLFSLVVFTRGRQDGPAYRALATLMGGMMVYAIVFYLIWEARTFRATGADLRAVALCNGPWLVLTLLLLARIYWVRPTVTRLPQPAAA